MISANSIHKFFYPHSIVLIGASSKPKSIGYEVLRTIQNFNYTGKLFVINPTNKEILNVQCYASLSDIKDEIDLAIILVPKKIVLQCIKDCALKNIKNVIIITAGFKETGKEGQESEKQILEFAKKENIRIVGPNCMGLINSYPDIKLNATFAAEVPQYAKVGFMSQSGGLGAALLNTINETGYWFNQFLSVGNKADVCENDLLKYWGNSPDVHTLTMYLESFNNGKEFFRLAKQITRRKPVVILKSAKGESGIKAASSHTGALASMDGIVDVMFKQCGVTRVETTEEMFETAKAFEKIPLPKGKNAVVISNAGGPAILATDELEKNNFHLAKLSENTVKKLKSFLVEDASANNPIDMLPMANKDTYKQAVELALKDKNVDIVMAIFVEPVMVQSFEIIQTLAKMQQVSKKPLLIVTFPLHSFWQEWKEKGDREAIINSEVELPIKIMKNLYDRFVYLNNLRNKNYRKIETNITKETDQKIKEVVKLVKEEFIPPSKISEIFQLLNLPIVKSIEVNNYKEFKKGTGELQFPLVLKIKSKTITHKSDIGGVITNIKNKKALKKAFQKMEKNLEEKGLLDKIDNYEIQEFINSGIEVIIGGFRDENFGPVIMFGAGGKLVELIKDTNFALAPLSRIEAEALIKNSKIYHLLKGYRDQKAIDINPLIDIILKLSEFFIKNRKIKEFDINPLLLNSEIEKSKIVDVRIKL